MEPTKRLAGNVYKGRPAKVPVNKGTAGICAPMQTAVQRRKKTGKKDKAASVLGVNKIIPAAAQKDSRKDRS